MRSTETSSVGAMFSRSRWLASQSLLAGHKARTGRGAARPATRRGGFALAIIAAVFAYTGLVPVAGTIDWLTRRPRHPFFSAGFIPVESTIRRLARRERLSNPCARPRRARSGRGSRSGRGLAGQSLLAGHKARTGQVAKHHAPRRTGCEVASIARPLTSTGLVPVAGTIDWLTRCPRSPSSSPGSSGWKARSAGFSGVTFSNR
jgi:hypothetical protein